MRDRSSRSAVTTTTGACPASTAARAASTIASSPDPGADTTATSDDADADADAGATADAGAIADADADVGATADADADADAAADAAAAAAGSRGTAAPRASPSSTTVHRGHHRSNGSASSAATTPTPASADTAETNRAAAPARSFHHPSGTLPTTFAASTTTCGVVVMRSRSAGHEAPKPGCSGRSSTSSTGTHGGAPHHGRVRPEPQVEDRRVAEVDAVVGDAGFFGGLAEGTGDGVLAQVSGAARDAPGAAVVAPLDAVLQEHAAGAVVDEQPGGAEASPGLGAVGSDRPGVTGVAGAGRRPGRGCVWHLPSLPHGADDGPRTGHRASCTVSLETRGAATSG